MSTLIDTLLADNLKALLPYESARRLFSGADTGSEGGARPPLWLNANESPYSNAYEINPERLNRYPDCQPPAVVNAYALYAGINPEQLLVSRGADEAIELLIRTFCTPGKDKILICPPTYGMYAISAETCNVGIVKTPLRTDFSLDVPAICAFKGKVNL
ncbi:MAG: histidinol-phosphate aminotransferase, partial [Paraglaciecola sp.]